MMSEPCEHDFVWTNRDTDDDYEVWVCRACGKVDIEAHIPDEPDAYWDESDAEIDAYLRSVGYDPDVLVANMRERLGHALDQSPLKPRNQNNEEAGDE